MPSQRTAGLTTAQLVALAQSTGDRGAFDRLFSLYDARLKAFLRARAGAGDADDLLQETYVKAFLKIGQFQGGSQFSTWLFRIAINEFLAAKRKQRLVTKVKTFFFSSDEACAQEPAPMESMIDLERSLRDLNTNQYDTYVLAKVFGYSHTEIAEQLNMPLGSVKSYISQANQLLNL